MATPVPTTAPVPTPLAPPAPTPAPTAKPVEEPVETHQHSWEPVYTTVHHEEVGHYESREISPAWDEPEYASSNICSVCGVTGGNDIGDHILFAHDGLGYYYYASYPTGNMIHHDAVYEETWIVDSPAFEEQVISHYACACEEPQSA